MESQDNFRLQQVGAFTTKEFADDDYKDYIKWYSHLKRARGDYPERQMLSDDGLIITYNGVKVVAGFLYVTNSNIAMIEFVIANPKAKRDIRKKALNILLTHLESIAIHKCYDIMLILTNNTFYGNTLTEGFNYLRGDTPHFEYVKRLWQQEH